MPTPLTRNRLILHAPPGRYLLNDDFTFDLPVNSVAGSAAWPGPGLRRITDGNGKLSLLAGALSFATGGVGQGDPGLWYDPIERVTGRMCIGQMQATSGGLYVGFDSDQSGQISDSIMCRPGSSDIFAIVNNVAGVSVGTSATGTIYKLAAILRRNGVHLLIKGGAFSEWTLLWIGSAGTGNALYPSVGSASGTTTVGTCDFLQVPTGLWVPSPVISDGFGSSFGTTDGLGHGEALWDGIGGGGSGLTWVQNTGTWQTSGGSANAATLGGGIAIATVDSGKADVMVTGAITRSTGDAGVVVRYADASNYVRAIHNGTNVQLVKVAAGTPTTLINTAATYSASASLRVICYGQKFRVYYNNLMIGSEQTIADASLASGTKQGLYTSNTGNTFDSLVIYARGTGGEYAALDAF